MVITHQSPEDFSDFQISFPRPATKNTGIILLAQCMGPLQLEITSYKKRHAAEQMPLWDIENKDTKFKFKCPSASFTIQYGVFCTM